MLVNIDPCSLEPVLMSCLVVYTKLVIEGKNIRNKENIRSDTVRDYIQDVNDLFSRRRLPIPVPNFSDSSNPVATLVDNLRKEESIANQRIALTPPMVARILEKGQTADHLSLDSLMYDITRSAREIGPRAAEVSQKTASKPDYHIYPSGRRVVKAMCTDWWTGFDSSGSIVPDVTTSEHKVKKMRIIWKIQKNRRNNEPLTYVVNEAAGTLFSVPNAVISMIRRARALNQPDDLPMAVYKSKSCKIKYLTARVITNYLRKIAREVHPTWPADEINRISAHSYRVWACILLHEAGKKGDYIKKRLRWLSEAYRVYLRDSEILASQHNHGNTNYTNLIKQIMLTATSLPQNVDYTVSEDESMGPYHDLD